MISQCMVTSFKQQILLGEHDLDTDVLKLALYTSGATLNADTTVYSTTDEVATNAAYSAGGATLTGVTVSTSGTTAFVTFDNVVFTGAPITAFGALIYNSSKSDKAIAVLSFGADKTSTDTFIVQIPAGTSSAAILRIA